MGLALEREIHAQTWEGPWDWSACIPNPCASHQLFPEYSHAALIPTGLYRGKVLLWRREFDATCNATVRTHGYIFDPLAPTNLLRIEDSIPSELLCSGSSWDSKGRLVVVGSNRLPPSFLDGAYGFDPGSLGRPTGSGCHLRIQSRAWVTLDDMIRPRFYPTILALTKATISYDPSATSCTSIVGGAHLVLGGPLSGDSTAHTWSCFELLPYGQTHWACAVDALGAVLPPPNPPLIPPLQTAPAGYVPTSHPQEPPQPPTNLPLTGKLSSYPRAFQLSNGDVLVAHDVETAPANNPMEWFVLRFNQGGAHKFEFWRGLVDPLQGHPGPSSERDYGSAVLMHMRSLSARDRVIALGGSAPTLGSNPVATVQEFRPDPTLPAPAQGSTVNGWWHPKRDLLIPRDWSGAVVLPDGTILMSGGARQFSPGVVPIAEPEIYDPGAVHSNFGTSTAMPANTAGGTTLPTHRLYHSFSLLLPDGSVFIGGGEAPAQQFPGFLAGPYSGEIFQPPYMPQTTGLDMPYIGSVGSEQPMSAPSGAPLTFNVTVENCRSNAFTVQGVVLTRPGAVTHFFDNDQRYIELGNDPVWQNINGPTVTLTVHSLPENLGPPGWYMLWVIVTPVGSSQRLPTHAEFVRFY